MIAVLHRLELVRAAEARRFVAPVAPALREGLVGRQKTFSARARQRVVVRMRCVQVARPFEGLLSVLVVVFRSGALAGLQSVWQVRRCPVAPLSRPSRVVGVVDVSEHGQARAVREAQGEEPSQIFVLRAVCRLRVGYPADGVLLLEVHVHHQRAVGFLPSRKLFQIRLLLEHLYLVHHVGRQVLEGDFRVTPEEVLAVDEQVADDPAVHGDHAVVLQLGPRQLFDERVEHGALRQLEGVGVVYDGVPLHHHLDFRGRHHGLPEHLLPCLRPLCHLHLSRKIQAFVMPFTQSDLEGEVSGLVVLVREPQQVAAAARYFGIGIRV